MDSATIVLLISLVAALALAVKLTLDMQREKLVDADRYFHERMELQDKLMLWSIVKEIESRKRNEGT